MRLHNLPPHSVVVSPVREGSAARDTIAIPASYEEAHASLGWVEAVSVELEEHIDPNDLVIFVPYKQSQVQQKRQWEHWKKNLYRLHEDDIVAVLEDW